VSFRLAVPPEIRPQVGNVPMPRHDKVRLWVKMHEELTAAAAREETWRKRKHAQFPDSFFWNIVLQTLAGRTVRCYCICQRTAPEVITLRVFAPIKS
jgi:hypothetical protein